MEDTISTMFQLATSMKKNAETMQKNIEAQRKCLHEQQRLVSQIVDDLKKVNHNAGNSSQPTQLGSEIKDGDSELLNGLDEVEIDEVEIKRHCSFIGSTSMDAYHMFDEMPKPIKEEVSDFLAHNLFDRMSGGCTLKKLSVIFETIGDHISSGEIRTFKMHKELDFLVIRVNENCGGSALPKESKGIFEDIMKHVVHTLSPLIMVFDPGIQIWICGKLGKVLGHWCMVEEDMVGHSTRSRRCIRWRWHTWEPLMHDEDVAVEFLCLVCAKAMSGSITKMGGYAYGHYDGMVMLRAQFAIGDWVWVKLQPYRQVSVHLRTNEKLSARYFGHFKVLERIGQVAYKLEFPLAVKIHNVLHVSQLKGFRGLLPSEPHIPVGMQDTNPALFAAEPETILDKRMVKRRNGAVVQFLVKWKDMVLTDATWEMADDITVRFPNFQIGIVDVISFVVKASNKNGGM